MAVSLERRIEQLEDALGVRDADGALAQLQRHVHDLEARTGAAAVLLEASKCPGIVPVPAAAAAASGAPLALETPAADLAILRQALPRLAGYVERLEVVARCCDAVFDESSLAGACLPRAATRATICPHAFVFDCLPQCASCVPALFSADVPELHSRVLATATAARSAAVRALHLRRCADTLLQAFSATVDAATELTLRIEARGLRPSSAAATAAAPAAGTH